MKLYFVLAIVMILDILSQDIISIDNNIVTSLYNQLLHQKYFNLAFVGLPWKTLPFLLSEY